MPLEGAADTTTEVAAGVAAGATPDAGGARVWTWRRLVAVTAAKSLLVGLVGLAAWGALPALIGWHPTTVSSGSMLPRLHVGDIAVSRPLHGQAPPLQSVLLYDDPDHPGRLRMHRFIQLRDDGLMVTRGDANPAEDSTPIGLDAVRGIGTLRVPWIGLPIVWLREGQWLFLGLTAAALVLTLVVASSGRDDVFDDDHDTRDGDDENGDGDNDAEDGEDDAQVGDVAGEASGVQGSRQASTVTHPLTGAVDYCRRSSTKAICQLSGGP